MASILEEFAYGNLTAEPPFFGRDREYAEAVKCVSGSEQKLLKLLDGADRELFLSYADMQSELNRLTAAKNMIYGFRLGLLMTAESFIGMDELYAN